jgi:amidase
LTIREHLSSDRPVTAASLGSSQRKVLQPLPIYFYLLIRRWGAVCNDGVKSLVPGVDTLGILARSISDLQLIAPLLDIYSADPTTHVMHDKPLSQCSFAFVKTDIYDTQASDDLRETWSKAQFLLRQSGAQVTELDLPTDFEGWLGPNGRIRPMCIGEGRTALLPEYLAGKGKLGADLVKWLDKKMPKGDIIKIRDDLAALRPKFDEIAKRYDAIITPSAPNTAPRGLESTGNPYFGTLFTSLHAPVVHVPGFAGKNGLPIGLSLIAAR